MKPDNACITRHRRLSFTASTSSHARLPAKVRETATLTVGTSFSARYEIYAHEIMGRVAGLSPSQIGTLAAGA
jgi:4-carboxymuconolactone decarboxylase